MGKNVIIAEGERGRRFSNVSRLLTDKQTGIDAWVPVDERRTIQKYIYQNGGYVAIDDGVYGYSKLTVNIPGGAQGYTVPTVVTPPYDIEVIDTSVEPSLLPSVPGSVGSSVVGIDPDTGLMSVMTVNPDGTLSKKLIPTSIRVLMPPAKLSYHEGEKIQYAGLVVELLDPNGDNFQDELFPQGIISWSPVRNLLHPEYDLITPIEYAGNDGYFICPEFNWNYDNFARMYVATQPDYPIFAYVDGVSAEDYTNFPVVLQKLNSPVTLTVHCICEYNPRFDEPYTLDTSITYTFNVVDDFDNDIYVAAFSNKVLGSDSTDNIDAISVVFAFESSNTSTGEYVINLEKNYDPHGHTDDYPFFGDERKMRAILHEKPISHYDGIQTDIFTLSAVLDNPPYKKYKTFNIESSSVPVNIASKAINKRLLDPYNGAAFYESLGYIGWDMVYGENRAAGRSIPVQWKSPYDGNTYEDTFQIEISQA